MNLEFIGKTLLLEDVGADEKKGERILVIGDLHLGFGESMRESGYAVPVKIYEEIIEEFDLIFEHINGKYENYHNVESGVEGEKGKRTGDLGVVDKIILLGDLKHEFGRIMRDEWNEIGNFIDYLSGKLKKNGRIVIVKGNHDTMTEFVTRKKEIEVVDYYLLGDCAFVHGDKDFDAIYNTAVRKWFMGHGHPAIVLQERDGKGREGIKKEKYKCFLTGKWKGKEVYILPSFFDVNEGTDVRGLTGKDMGFAWDFNLENFEVYIVEGGTLGVLEFGKIKKI